jgi:hypothetical protein
MSSRIRGGSMQGPESDASTLATLACPAGPSDEPAQRPFAWWFRPSVALIEAAGCEPNRCRRRVAIGAVLPRVASGHLGLL